MSNWNRLFDKLKTLGWLLTMGASMSACATGGTSWKEEVLLHDGSEIIVERSVERGGRHEIGQQPPIKEESLGFTLPDTNESVIWRSQYSEDIGLADFQPLLLDISKRMAYVVAAPVGCLSYNKWGRPNPPYVVFKYQNTTWIRIALQELPAEIKTPNLIFSSPDNEVEKLGKRFVTVAMVQHANRDLRQPEYKTILRESLAGSGVGLTSCPIPTTAAAKLIAPEINGQLLEYNWWPLAQDWLNKTIRGNR